MNDNFPMPGCRIERITRDSAELVHVAAHGTELSGRCPDCGRASRAVHSRYRRRPADLPVLGSQVRVGLRVRRFYCRNTACARQTFAERLPELVAPRARRTRRLAEAQGRVGAVLGGEASSRLLSRLAMPASAATVLRSVRSLALPAQDAPRAVGVDDWAMCKGRTYGTIVVDLERHRVVDLLSDRTAETLADWLRQRPGVRVVARDRSTEYARGIALGAPDAVQVCDRWHLLANVRQAVERWLHATHARLRQMPEPPAGGEAPPIPPRRERAFRRNGPERAARAERRVRWRARYEEVRRRHLAGEPLLAIARAMGLARSTVRKFARAETFPARLPRGPGPSTLDPYLPHLERRLAEGCENGSALWRELRGMGYPGGDKLVHRWLGERRTTPAKVGRRRKEDPDDARTAARRDAGPPLPAPRQLTWLLVQPVAALGPADAAVVARVEQDGEAKAVAGLARRFAALVRACGVEGRRDGRAPAEPAAELDAWLAEARACGVATVETFAAGLETDGAAVRAALTEPWSSGQAEGQVNRLKLLKRQSYGRAGFDLLRRRVLLAA
ncbi:MAG: ISL3 family transposase [Acetobacteraceae bacterium]|nr:ISL3 family transposase [Acetobacteraceae bacterium]